MLKIRMLPAREGDALWIKWGDETAPRQMLVDMGVHATGESIRKRFDADLTIAERHFDLLVVTHVDRDHIEGVVSGIAEPDPLPGLLFCDVWFNGWPHLDGGVAPGAPTHIESFGSPDGERFTTWLKTQPWNQVVYRKGIFWDTDGEPPTYELSGGLKLTVLGPTPARLKKLRGEWAKDAKKAFKKGDLAEVSEGIESYGPKTPPKLDTKLHLRKLAEKDVDEKDDSPSNGASISLLLSYDGFNIVLGGDAWGDDLTKALLHVGNGSPLAIDAFKLPHHCSKKNVSKELVEAVECPLWLISTDGNRYRHPDPVAIARILQYSAHDDAHLAFNAPSKYNGWWSNSDWKTRFGYTSETGSETDGLSISFPTDE